MPPPPGPTIQNEGAGTSARRPPPSASRPGAKDKPTADLMMKVRYKNRLPDIPFEPKFLTCPFTDLSRFVNYKQTSLEKNYKYELLTEPDLGVKIDLINPKDTYEAVDIHQQLDIDEIDQKLLEEEPANQHDIKRSSQHRKVLPWMRKTEYISAEVNRYGVQSERHETKVGYKIKKHIQDQETMYRSVQSQIEAIEKSFEDVKPKCTQHHSKPGVVAVEELPLLPDFDLWKHPFAQVLFDADPTPHDVPPTVAYEKMSQALIRGMMDEEGEQFVAYFLPTNETLEKQWTLQQQAESTHKPEQSDETDQPGPSESNETESESKTDKPNKLDVHEYKMAREYTWTVKGKTEKGYEQENHFVLLKPGQACYNELDSRVRLNRRRAPGQSRTQMANTRLVVKLRDETPNEQAQQQHRLHMLFNPYDELDEPEMEQEPAEEADQEEGPEPGTPEEAQDNAQSDDGSAKEVDNHGEQVVDDEQKVVASDHSDKSDSGSDNEQPAAEPSKSTAHADKSSGTSSSDNDDSD